MATALVIKNGSVLPCTPVSLSISRDPNLKSNYALFLPPQKLVFSRNGAEAVSELLVSMDLPLWMGCVKLQPNFKTDFGGETLSIRFIDILPDGTEGQVIEPSFTAELTITAYAATLRLVPKSGKVPFTGEIGPFVGCKIVAILTKPIQLTQSHGFELCEPITKSCDELCGRAAMFFTTAPEIKVISNAGRLIVVATDDFSGAAYSWTINNGDVALPNNTNSTTLINVPENTINNTSFDVAVTVTFYNDYQYTLVKTLVYHPP